MTPDNRFHRLCTHGLSHRVLCALAMTAIMPTAFAQASGSEAPGVSGTAILQMLLALGLIIAILFAGAYLLRRLNGGERFGQTGPMKIVGGLTIGPRERIIMVEVGETWLVVGVVPGQIKTLHTQPKGELPLPGNAETSFGHWLKKMTERSNESK